METTTKLDLIFKTTEGKTYILSIDHPDVPDPTKIVNSMNNIIASNVITTKYGNLSEIKGARVVTKQVEDIALS